MIVEHVRVYVSPQGEVRKTTDRAGWPEVADAVIRMHRARIQQKKEEAGRTYSRMVKAGLLMMDDRELADMEMLYTACERCLVKSLQVYRKRMRQGYCPYNRERYRLEDAYALAEIEPLWIVSCIDGKGLLIPLGE